jgi:hypothetical protein
MATPASKLRPVTRDVTLVKTLDSDGEPVVVTVRRLRTTSVFRILEIVPVVGEDRSAVAPEIGSLTVEDTEAMLTKACRVICAAAVSPRFRMPDEEPVDGVESASIEAVHEEDVADLMSAILDLSGVAPKEKTEEREEAEATGTFPPEHAGRRGGRRRAGRAV